MYPVDAIKVWEHIGVAFPWMSLPLLPWLMR
jgi:hypothetical protein